MNFSITNFYFGCFLPPSGNRSEVGGRKAESMKEHKDSSSLHLSTLLKKRLSDKAIWILVMKIKTE